MDIYSNVIIPVEIATVLGVDLETAEVRGIGVRLLLADVISLAQSLSVEDQEIVYRYLVDEIGLSEGDASG